MLWQVEFQLVNMLMTKEGQWGNFDQCCRLPTSLNNVLIALQGSSDSFSYIIFEIQRVSGINKMS